MAKKDTKTEVVEIKAPTIEVHEITITRVTANGSRDESKRDERLFVETDCDDITHINADGTISKSNVFSISRHCLLRELSDLDGIIDLDSYTEGTPHLYEHFIGVCQVILKGAKCTLTRQEMHKGDVYNTIALNRDCFVTTKLTCKNVDEMNDIFNSRDGQRRYERALSRCKIPKEDFSQW